MFIKHKIIFLGSYQRQVSFVDVVDSAMELLKCIQNESDFGNLLMVKSNGCYIDYSEIDLPNTIASGVNHERDVTFPELGYRIEFRLFIQNSIVYGSFLIGATSPDVVNTFTMSIPMNLDLEKCETRERIKRIFVGVSRSYNWFWGAVINNYLRGKFSYLFRDGRPSTLYWLNYFQADITKGLNQTEYALLRDKYGVKLDQNIVTIDYNLCFNESIYEINNILLAKLI